jgi:hypothetical protein
MENEAAGESASPKMIHSLLHDSVVRLQSAVRQEQTHS